MQKTSNKLPDQKILDIELKYIEALIPVRLPTRLSVAGLKTIGDVMNYPVESFASIPSVGKVLVGLLNEFKEQVQKQPGLFYQHACANIDRQNELEKLHAEMIESHQLLKDHKTCKDRSLLGFLKIIILQYSAIQNTEIKRRVLVDFYGITSEPQKLADIAQKCGLTSARANSLRRKLLGDILYMLKGNVLTFTKASLPAVIVKKFQPLIQNFEHDILQTYGNFIDFLSLKPQQLQDINTEKLLMACIDMFGFYALPSKKTPFTRAKVLFRNRLYEPDILKIVEDIFIMLYEEGPLLSEDEIISRMKYRDYFFCDFMVNSALKNIPEFDHIDILDKRYYQIRKSIPSLN